MGAKLTRRTAEGFEGLLEFGKGAKKMDEQQAPEDFALEASVEPGHLPQRVIEELRHSYRVARDYSEAFGDCVKAQAEKHKIVPAALRKYIAALEDDKVPKVRKEAESLQTLIGSAEQ